FFSGRRRRTSFSRDWSSDVCSSDLDWIATLKQTLRMDEFIINNKKVMDKNDPEKKVGFYVDEWGTWYDVEEGTNPGFLFQQNSRSEERRVGREGRSRWSTEDETRSS